MNKIFLYGIASILCCKLIAMEHHGDKKYSDMLLNFNNMLVRTNQDDDVQVLNVIKRIEQYHQMRCEIVQLKKDEDAMRARCIKKYDTMGLEEQLDILWKQRSGQLFELMALSQGLDKDIQSLNATLQREMITLKSYIDTDFAQKMLESAHSTEPVAQVVKQEKTNKEEVPNPVPLSFLEMLKNAIPFPAFNLFDEP